jgi:hypothetical protein
VHLIFSKIAAAGMTAHARKDNKHLFSDAPPRNLAFAQEGDTLAAEIIALPPEFTPLA